MVVSDLTRTLRVALIECFVSGLLVETRLNLLRRRGRSLHECVGSGIALKRTERLPEVHRIARQTQFGHLLSHEGRFRRQVLIDHRKGLLQASQQTAGVVLFDLSVSLLLWSIFWTCDGTNTTSSHIDRTTTTLVVLRSGRGFQRRVDDGR